MLDHHSLGDLVPHHPSHIGRVKEPQCEVVRLFNLDDPHNEGPEASYEGGDQAEVQGVPVSRDGRSDVDGSDLSRFLANEYSKEVEKDLGSICCDVDPEHWPPKPNREELLP